MKAEVANKACLTYLTSEPISRRVYYLRFCIFGCGYYSSNYPSNTPDKKIINIFFLRFDMIIKLPLEHISVKLLLMAPFYVWKVEIFLFKSSSLPSFICRYYLDLPPCQISCAYLNNWLSYSYFYKVCHIGVGKRDGGHFAVLFLYIEHL